MMSRRRLYVALGGVLEITAHATFLSNFPSHQRGPVLFGFAPYFLLAAVAGGLVAAATDSYVESRRQFLRIAWYPGWCLVASAPLFALLATWSYPIDQWAVNLLVFGSVLGVGREIGRW